MQQEGFRVNNRSIIEKKISKGVAFSIIDGKLVKQTIRRVSFCFKVTFHLHIFIPRLLDRFW
jgi:hypothetical protein